MKVNYSVSFEFDQRAPVTHRGTVEGWTAGTCTRRAVEEAQKALTPINWSSMVCVLLERLGEDQPKEASSAIGETV